MLAACLSNQVPKPLGKRLGAIAFMVLMAAVLRTTFSLCMGSTNEIVQLNNNIR